MKKVIQWIIGTLVAGGAIYLIGLWIFSGNQSNNSSISWHDYLIPSFFLLVLVVLCLFALNQKTSSSMKGLSGFAKTAGSKIKGVFKKISIKRKPWFAIITILFLALCFVAPKISSLFSGSLGTSKVSNEILVKIDANSDSKTIALRTGYNAKFKCPDNVTWTTNTSGKKEYNPGDTGKKANYMIFHNKNNYPVEFVINWVKR